MLSTGLFTIARFYSPPGNPEKLNADRPLARFLSPAAPPKAPAPPPVVDKFPPATRAKSPPVNRLVTEHRASDGWRGRGGGFFLQSRFFAFDVGEAALAFFDFVGLCAHISLHCSQIAFV
jgi:hypothetical protein